MTPTAIKRVWAKHHLPLAPRFQFAAFGVELGRREIKSQVLRSKGIQRG